MSKKLERHGTERSRRPEVLIKPSIIERIRRDPDAEEPRSANRGRDPLAESIRDNIDWVLNTRRVADLPDEENGEMEDLNRSVYVFGVPDFSGVSLESPKQQSQLQSDIADSIRMFEPRLTEVRVDRPQRVGIAALHFRVRGAMRRAESGPAEPISFDVALNSSSGVYQIRGDD